MHKILSAAKCRSGAILLAGDDHIPIKSGSNKKEFKRENIHAEMSVLKGCARPAGKDMLIARLAPSKAASGRGGGKGGGGKREYDRRRRRGGGRRRRFIARLRARGR